MSKKKIKKIDEFLDNDSKFEIRICTDTLSDEEIQERRERDHKLYTENIKAFKKVKLSDTLDIDFYRKIVTDLKEKGECSTTDAELDEFCLEVYGEPFFIKTEKDSNE